MAGLICNQFSQQHGFLSSTGADSSIPVDTGVGLHGAIVICQGRRKSTRYREPEWYDDDVMPRLRISPMASSQRTRSYEIELIAGLERFVDGELANELGRREYRPGEHSKAGRMSIEYSGPVELLLSLRSAVAVHIVERFAVSRPRALLGHEHFNRLLGAIREVVDLHPPGTFKTFRVSAAGSDSGTFRRLRMDLGAALGLEDRSDEGHLHLSVRRRPSGFGWEALIRLTPLPLSARAWRVCNRPDALNATIAHSMAVLAGPRNTERFLNLGCGSGTLLVERMGLGPAASTIGIDTDPAALACAERNLEAADVRQVVNLVRGDIRRVPLPSRSFDTVVANLPFGMLGDTALDLDNLYMEVLREVARLIVPYGAFIVVTARRQLFEDALAQSAGDWKHEAEFPLRVPFRGGYITPAIFVLRRA